MSRVRFVAVFLTLVTLAVVMERAQSGAACAANPICASAGVDGNG